MQNIQKAQLQSSRCGLVWKALPVGVLLEIGGATIRRESTPSLIFLKKFWKKLDFLSYLPKSLVVLEV
jgi:hypothetical protein